MVGFGLVFAKMLIKSTIYFLVLKSFVILVIFMDGYGAYTIGFSNQTCLQNSN